MKRNISLRHIILVSFILLTLLAFYQFSFKKVHQENKFIQNLNISENVKKGSSQLQNNISSQKTSMEEGNYSTICGNGICEPSEDSENCCVDCGCLYSYQICNNTTKTCEYPKVNLSEIGIKLILQNYFAEKNETLLYFNIIKSLLYKNKPAYRCEVETLKDGYKKYYLLIITEDKEVIEMPVI